MKSHWSPLIGGKYWIPAVMPPEPGSCTNVEIAFVAPVHGAPVCLALLRPGELFGLHEQDVFSWNVGANYHPTDVVAVGVNAACE